MLSLDFLLTSFIVVLIPGTGVIYMLSCGLTLGKRSVLPAALGDTFGILPHLIASITGLAAILHASAIAFQFIKYIGVVYLLYLAWSMLRETSSLNLDRNRQSANSPRFGSILSKGIFINALNPKLSIFFLAFLPQFISPQALNPTMNMIGLGGVFMLMTFVVFLGYGFSAAFLRDHVISNTNTMLWLKRIFAGAFAGMGLKLAFTE